MTAAVRRALVAALVSGAFAALLLAAAYASRPGLDFGMDGPLPDFISGIYAPERDQTGTFAWSSSRVLIDLAGIDRQVAWTCAIRFRGARGGGLPQPVVDARVDGQHVASIPATNDFQDLGLHLPAVSAAGSTVDLEIGPTFVPGGADRRELGAQIDRLACRPAHAVVRPPSNALALASVAAGAFAAALALLGLSLTSAVAAAVVISFGQTAMLVIGAGIYGRYPAVLPWTAAWIGGIAFLIGAAAEILRGRRLSSTSRFVVACSASALYLKVIGLLHPAKPVVDALFHAHRFDGVLAGADGYFFTQSMPDGVTFPYAIGLYLFAAPWAWLTTDHVALVRIVTATADVMAGALLYPVVLAAWGDRRAAAFAAVLYLLVPLPFVVLGNANLTNIFGQSVALVVMAAAVAWRLDFGRPLALVGLTALITLALCSHVSTVATLPATLGVFVVLNWWRGDRAARQTSLAIVVATAVALLASWLIYYRHFMDVYRVAFTRMFAEDAGVGREAATEAVKGYMTYGERVVDLVQQALANAGWPLLVLAAVGAWSLWRRGTRDRLLNAVTAWATVWLVFSLSTVFAGVDREYVRYAAEFLGRINLATVPMLAILAARGAALAWEPGDIPLRRALQWATVALLVATLVLAVGAWTGWLLR